MYIYYDNQGRVKMFSENKLKGFGNLTAKSLPKPANFDEKKNNHAILLYKSGKIEFEKSSEQLAKEKEGKKSAVKEVVNQLKQSNSPEMVKVADIFSNLL